MLISVSKDVSYRVTDKEVSAMTLLSAIRRTVRRFSQFYKHTQTRKRVTIATCEIIVRFVLVCKIHVMVTCKFTWQMCRCFPLKEEKLR